MAKNEVKYRPATMADIENRDTNLFMNGEQVCVLMIHRSETIGDGNGAKLDYIMLTNKKKVQVEDLQVIDNGAPESEEVSPLMRQYNDMKKQKPDSLLLFRCGDFYETYQEDAKECAKILGITLTKKNDVSMAGFPHHALDQYLPKLIRAGKRVAICDLLPDPPKKPVKRGITELTTNNSELTTKNSETMKPNENESGRSATQGDACQSKNVQNNAQVDNIKTSADITEAQDIMPVVTPSAKAKPAENTGRTKIVVARVPKPGESADKPKVKIKSETKQEQANYSVMLLPTKDGGQWPKLYGFNGQGAAKRMAARLPNTVRAAWDRDADGNKRYFISGGKRYCSVFQQLADALNSGNEQEVSSAVLDVIAIYEGAVVAGKANRTSKPAKAQKPETRNLNAEGVASDKRERSGKPETKVYTQAELAEWLRKLNAGTDKEKAEAAKFFNDLAKAA